jgi:hypothetical protein
MATERRMEVEELCLEAVKEEELEEEEEDDSERIE